MSKLEQAAREVIRQHSMECLSDKTVDALREALAEQVHTPYCKQAPMCKTPCGNPDCVEQAEQEPVAIDGLARACNLAGIEYKDFLRIKAYLPIAAPVQQAEQEPVLWGDDKFAPHERPQKPKECADGCPPLQVCDYCQTAEQAEQEPVAWGYFDSLGAFIDALNRQHGAYQTPLYTHPVRIKDLTDDEIFNLNECESSADIAFARAVIEKFKEKNNANNNS